MSRPFIPVPRTCSVELIYGCYAQVLENVLHVRGAAPFTLADVQALRTCIDAWDNAQWKTLRCSNVILNRIRIKALDTPSSPMEDYSLPTPRPGATGANALPLSITFAIKFGSQYAGRSQRGRIFVPGVFSGHIAGNQMAGNVADLYLGELRALQPALTAANASWVHGVVSYRSDKTWRAEGQFTPITTIVYTDLNLDNQRRRLTGRGRT